MSILESIHQGHGSGWFLLLRGQLGRGRTDPSPGATGERLQKRGEMNGTV